MKLGDRVLYALVPILLVGGVVVIAGVRQDQQRLVERYAAEKEGVGQWDGGVRWLQPRPGVSRRIA